MANLAGRPFYLYGWETYDWPQCKKYVATGVFASLTWTAQTQTTAQASVSIAGPAASPSQLGILYGLYANSYDRKTPLAAGPGPITVKLKELQRNTQYHTAAYGVGADGTTYLGPDTLLTTAP